ncbi:MAG TPA: efflux transporter outer membrane subunit [Casimicrobiaceae bacterium]|nr:efflux transporter outer membrane subunit [Casimicrobiaceae bacterium]
MHRRLLACATATLLGACAMGPDYVRPKVDAPMAFRFEPKSVTETADTAWWKQFDDPVLDGLIADALANNMNVKVAVANVEQAAGVFTQTRSQLFPQVGYSATGERVRTTEAGVSPALAGRIPNPQTAYQAVLTASWEIDLWGRIRRLSESALANTLASDDARRGVILSLVSSVANDYLQLRGLDEQLVISKRTLDAYSESLKLFELQFQYGQVSQMNVAQAQSQYETAAAQIPAIESQIAQTETALSILLGRNPGPIARGKSINELKLPSVPAGLPSQLLERRPDLMQSEQALIAANAQIGAAKALYFPTISLTGAFGGASSDLSKLFTGPARVWNYAGQAIGPIFTFGGVSGQVAQAEGGQQAALYNYELSIQNAFGDVDNALIANQKLQEQADAQARLVKALQDYERLAMLQYNGGYTSYTTVLQAEQSLFPAELTLASLRAQVFGSSVNIYKAMGGGWVDIADKATAEGAANVQPVSERVKTVPLF